VTVLTLTNWLSIKPEILPGEQATINSSKRLNQMQAVGSLMTVLWFSQQCVKLIGKTIQVEISSHFKRSRKNVVRRSY